MEELIIKFNGPADFVPDAGQDHAKYVSTLGKEETENPVGRAN
jgi:hypothetical protein